MRNRTSCCTWVGTSVQRSPTNSYRHVPSVALVTVLHLQWMGQRKGSARAISQGFCSCIHKNILVRSCVARESLSAALTAVERAYAIYAQ
jgi:hypothetical protein